MFLTLSWAILALSLARWWRRVLTKQLYSGKHSGDSKMCLGFKTSGLVDVFTEYNYCQASSLNGKRAGKNPQYSRTQQSQIYQSKYLSTEGWETGPANPNWNNPPSLQWVKRGTVKGWHGSGSLESYSNVSLMHLIYSFTHLCATGKEARGPTQAAQAFNCWVHIPNPLTQISCLGWKHPFL